MLRGNSDPHIVRSVKGVALGWLAVALLAGCGSSSRGQYPLVTVPEIGHQRPVTTPNGAVVSRPARPSAYTAMPSPSCERAVATVHGLHPGKREIVIPPTPGLRAIATSPREVRLEWSFRSRPHDCRPQALLLGIVANDDWRATPTNRQLPVDGDSGVATITYPEFLPPPDVALASAYMEDGRRSRTARVLIRPRG